jgi:hypothetical protein
VQRDVRRSAALELRSHECVAAVHVDANRGAAMARGVRRHAPRAAADLEHGLRLGVRQERRTQLRDG